MGFGPRTSTMAVVVVVVVTNDAVAIQITRQASLGLAVTHRQSDVIILESCANPIAVVPQKQNSIVTELYLLSLLQNFHHK